MTETAFAEIACAALGGNDGLGVFKHSVSQC